MAVRKLEEDLRCAMLPFESFLPLPNQWLNRMVFLMDRVMNLCQNEDDLQTTTNLKEQLKKVKHYTIYLTPPLPKKKVDIFPVYRYPPDREFHEVGVYS